MSDGATNENTLAVEGLEYCNQLFELEQKSESIPDTDRRKQHQFLSRSHVDEYCTWLETIFRPTRKMKKAIIYSMNQREYLCTSLDRNEIGISNNKVENAIQPIIVCRRLEELAFLRYSSQL